MFGDFCPRTCTVQEFFLEHQNVFIYFGLWLINSSIELFTHAHKCKSAVQVNKLLPYCIVTRLLTPTCHFRNR